jgi:hypothetical protein
MAMQDRLVLVCYISNRFLADFQDIMLKLFSINDWHIWFANPSIHLDVRFIFAQTLILIDMLTKERSGFSAKDIFRWKRGQESLIKFISTVQIDSFWESAVREYEEKRRPNEKRARKRARLGMMHAKPLAGSLDFQDRHSPSSVRDLFAEDMISDDMSMDLIDPVDLILEEQLLLLGPDEDESGPLDMFSKADLENVFSP